MHPDEDADESRVHDKQISVQKRQPQHEGLDPIREGVEDGRLHESEQHEEYAERSAAWKTPGNEMRPEIGIASIVHDAV